MTTVEYALGSNSLVHAPGIVRYLRAMYDGNRSDKVRAIRILSEGWSMPREAARYLLTCDESAIQVGEDNAVRFTFGGAR